MAAPAVEVTLEAFEREYPHIEVSIEVIGEFHAKIPALAAAGSLPDVVRSWEAMALDLGRNQQFIDIQAYVDGQADFNPDDFYTNWWTCPVEDGKRFGIPDAVATHMTFYNKDLFDASGVEYPDPSDFTWNHFEEIARGISDPDNKVWGSETIPVGWHMFSVKQAWQNTGSFYSADYRSCVIGDDPAVEALQYWADLLLDGSVILLLPSWWASAGPRPRRTTDGRTHWHAAHGYLDYRRSGSSRLPDIHWGPHYGVFRLELLQVEGNSAT